MNKKNINDILINYFGGKASKEELSQLEEWKSNGEDNLKRMQAFRTIYNETDNLKNWDQFDSIEAWDKLTTSIDNQRKKPVSTITNTESTLAPRTSASDHKIHSLSARWVKVAAVGAIILMAKYFYDWKQFQQPTTTTAMVTHFETDYSNKLVLLPDGTKVTLASHSSIDIDRNFSGHRTLQLQGDAYFIVAKDKTSPFTIHTDKGDVTVLGTQFNILNNKDKFELYVKEGKVAYQYKKRKLILTKDDIVVWKNQNIIKSKMYNKNYLSWQKGKLLFRDAQWMDVFEDLKRHFHVNIDYKSIKHSDCKLNTTFETNNIEEVLEELSILWKLDYTKSKSGIKIHSIGC